MVSAGTVILEYVCPTLGCIMGNIMFAAPYKSVKEAVVRGHLGDLNPTPWAFMLGNTIGWIAYSYLQQNLFLFFANSPGMLLSVWFNLCAAKLQYQDHHTKEMRKSFIGFLEESKSQEFQRSPMARSKAGNDNDQADDEPVTNTPWQTATDLGALVVQVTSQSSPAPAPHEKIVVGMVAFWTMLISLISLTNFTPRTDELIVGVCVNINLFFFYGAPLSTILTVLKERDSSSIHKWTMITNTVNGAFWTAYGIAVMDPFIYVPNGIGSLLGVVQMVMVVLFPRKAAKDDTQNDTVELSANEKTTEQLGEVKSATSQEDSEPTATPEGPSTQV